MAKRRHHSAGAVHVKKARKRGRKHHGGKKSAIKA